MKFRFPYNFNGFIQRDLLKDYIAARSIRFIPLRRVSNYLGDGSLQNFSNIYTDICQAMADYDYDYLQSIMEPTLFNACKESLEEIHENQYSLEYLEIEENNTELNDAEEEGFSNDTKQPENNNPTFMGLDTKKFPALELIQPFGYIYKEKDMHIYVDAKGALGPKINRSKNTDLKRIFGNDVSTFSFYTGKNVSWRDWFKKQVLILDIYYYTNRKLVLKDEEGKLIDGSSYEKDLFDHKLRFESYTDKIDWVLTDIDDFLDGNPYIPAKKGKVKDEETE